MTMVEIMELAKLEIQETFRLKWAAMSRMPDDVLVTMMELAEVEIQEILH